MSKPVINTVLNLDSFQSLAGINKPASMCDLIGCLRLIKVNVKYLTEQFRHMKTQEDKDFNHAMLNHLEQDKEFIENQIKHNIKARSDEANKQEEEAKKALDKHNWDDAKEDKKEAKTVENDQ